MLLLQTNRNQIQSISKALDNCSSMQSIYAELLFLTMACVCPPHILSDFWLRNLSFLFHYYIRALS